MTSASILAGSNCQERTSTFIPRNSEWTIDQFGQFIFASISLNVEGETHSVGLFVDSEEFGTCNGGAISAGTDRVYGEAKRKGRKELATKTSWISAKVMRDAQRPHSIFSHGKWL